MSLPLYYLKLLWDWHFARPVNAIRRGNLDQVSGKSQFVISLCKAAIAIV